MKTNKNLSFQGDISFLRVDKHVKKALLDMGVDVDFIVKNGKRIVETLSGKDASDAGFHAEKGMVLAQGESRAHYHAFRDADKVDVYEAVNDNGKKLRLVVVKSFLPIEHEEHNPIAFDPDMYVQGFQYEYDFSEEYRRLAD